jgi:hypothetical protein
MAKPAVRIRLTGETIGERVIKPQIKFSRSDDGGKGVLRITFGLDAIGDIVEDSEASVNDPDIKDNCRDALLTKDFFVRRKLSIAFSPDGSDGSIMTLTAKLPTKVPGTGTEIKTKKKKVMKKSKR